MAKKLNNNSYTLESHLPTSIWETMVKTPNLGMYNTDVPNMNNPLPNITKSAAPDPNLKAAGSLYDNINKMSTGLGIFEAGASMFGAAQSLLAKKPTVSRPHKVSFTKPRIESNVEATRSLIKENMGTGINTVLERAKEQGQDVSKVSPGIFSGASRIMRESAVELGGQQQDILNKKNIAISEIENQEASVNSQIENQYQARKDEVLSQDSYMRGVQLSQSISNLGGIFSRLMNERLMTGILKNNEDSDNQYYKLAMMQSMMGNNQQYNP